MSQHADTNEGIGEEDALNEWITQHKLNDAAQKLKIKKITLDELQELSQSFEENELRQYAKNELQLDLMSSVRFAKAVKSLASSAVAPPKQKTKIVRIVLSKEEDDAINNINHKNEEINKYINDALININTLKTLSSQNENELNVFRKQCITQINQRFDALISKSNKQIHKKSNILSQYVQSLKLYTQKLQNAELKTNELLNDSTVSKSKRQTKIVNISNNVLNKNIIRANITPKVSIEVNKKDILQYIAGIGSIRDWNYPDIPNISVNNIKASSVTVRMKNKKSTDQFSVELNDDQNDEKKINWKEIASNVSNVSSYNISNLNEYSSYGVRVKYKNDTGFGKYSNTAKFTTKKMGFGSSILTQTEKSTFLALLSKNGKRLGKSWNLLYRASRDGWTNFIFHQKCDNKEKTLTIIRTDSNNVFGGYRSKPFRNVGQRNCADDEAFLFLIRSNKNYQPQIFTIISEQHKTLAVYDYASTSTGIMIGFGNGHDLAIYMNGNTNTSSYTYKHSYNLPDAHYLNGGVRNFKLEEIEVFQAVE